MQKRLAEAEERAQLLKVEAEKVKQAFLAGFEDDVMRFNSEVRKIQTNLYNACLYGIEDQYSKMMNKLKQLDSETQLVLDELSKISKRNSKKNKLEKQNKDSDRKVQGAEEDASKEEGEVVAGKKKFGRVDPRLSKLLQTMPKEIVKFARPIVEKRLKGEQITPRHVMAVVSSAPSRNLLGSILKKRLEHYTSDKRQKYVLDLKAGKASSSGGPMPSPNLEELCDASGGYPVCIASRQGQHNLVKHLLELLGRSTVDVCDQMGMAPLLLAARAGYSLTVKFLLDAGAFADAVDTGRQNALMLACQQDKRFFFSELKRREDLLKSHANASGKGKKSNKSGKGGTKKEEETPVEPSSGTRILEFRPLQRDHDQVTKLLIEAGVNINHRDMWGRSALIHAAQCGNDSAVRRVIKSGARLNDCDNEKGWSALHYAVFNGHFFATYSLLKAGSDIDAVDDNNITPLILAADGEPKKELLELLLHNGADTGMMSTYGSSAASLSRGNGHESIVNLLRKGVSANYDPHNIVIERVTKHGKKIKQRLKRRKKHSRNDQEASKLIESQMGEAASEDSGVEDVDSDFEEAVSDEGDH